MASVWECCGIAIFPIVMKNEMCGTASQYRESDRNTASGDADSLVRRGQQPERSTAPRACRRESGFPSGSSRREHNWQATHGTRPPVSRSFLSLAGGEREERTGEVRSGGLVATQLSLRTGQARRTRQSCGTSAVFVCDRDQTINVTLAGEEFLSRRSLYILPPGDTRTRRFTVWSQNHVRLGSQGMPEGVGCLSALVALSRCA